MQISIRPKSLLGKWSVGLAAVFALLLVLFAAFVLLLVFTAALTGLGGVGSGPVGSIIGVAFGISGIGSFITGLISIIKSKERSILVFVAVVVGFFCLLFFLDKVLG